MSKLPSIYIIYKPYSHTQAPICLNQESFSSHKKASLAFVTAPPSYTRVASAITERNQNRSPILSARSSVLACYKRSYSHSRFHHHHHRPLYTLKNAATPGRHLSHSHRPTLYSIPPINQSHTDRSIRIYTYRLACL